MPLLICCESFEAVAAIVFCELAKQTRLQAQSTENNTSPATAGGR